MTISVIIPHYNGTGILRSCLDSLLSHDRIPEEIIVVDNGSSDDSVEMLKQHYSEVKLLTLMKNTGFTGANNAGLKEASGDMIVLLNNDCIVEKGWLNSLLDRMEDDSIGAVTSSMRNINDRDIIDSAGGELDWIGFSRDVGRGDPAALHSEVTDIPFPCGGAVMIRRDALPSPTTLFWKDLFIYYEDLDLGFELNRTGWRVVYEPKAVVRHVHSATALKFSYLKEYSCTRNRILVLKKHMNRKVFQKLSPLILTWQLLWVGTCLLRGRIFDAKAVFYGTFDAFKNSVEYFQAPISLETVFRKFAKPCEYRNPIKQMLCRKAENIISMDGRSF